jgi:hypothetical protein
MLKDMPKEGHIITTDKGKGKVIEVNPLRREIVVELENGVIHRIIKKECEACGQHLLPKEKDARADIQKEPVDGQFEPDSDKSPAGDTEENKPTTEHTEDTE